MNDFCRIADVHAARRFPFVAQDGTGLPEALHEVLEPPFLEQWQSPWEKRHNTGRHQTATTTEW